MLNMALLLRVVNEGENVVVNQAIEEVNPSVEVGSNTCVTSLESDFSVNEGKPRMGKFMKKKDYGARKRRDHTKSKEYI